MAKVDARLESRVFQALAAHLDFGRGVLQSVSAGDDPPLRQRQETGESALARLEPDDGGLESLQERRQLFHPTLRGGGEAEPLLHHRLRRIEEVRGLPGTARLIRTARRRA